MLSENQVEKKVERLRIDKGSEFYSTEFNEFCKDEEFFFLSIIQ